MNTRSIAASCGAWPATIAPSSSKICFRRSAKFSLPTRFKAVWNTWRVRPAASTSMMPTPVCRLPGSMPMMRTTPASGAWGSAIGRDAMFNVGGWRLVACAV